MEDLTALLAVEVRGAAAAAARVVAWIPVILSAPEVPADEAAPLLSAVEARVVRPMAGLVATAPMVTSWFAEQAVGVVEGKTPAPAVLVAMAALLAGAEAAAAPGRQSAARVASVVSASAESGMTKP